MKRKKKNTDNHDERVSFDFTLLPLNYTQVSSLTPTPEFIDMMSDPFEFARKLIDRITIPIDDLCVDMFDPYINSIATKEIAEMRKQLLSHYDTINRILASARGDVDRATRRREFLIQDREKLAAKLDELKKKEGTL